MSKYSDINEVEPTTGDWADTKDGVSIWSPVVCGDRFCRDQCGIGRTPIAWLLLAEVYWLAFIS